MTQTRPMPRRVFLPKWVWAVAFAVTIVGSWWTDTLWFFLGPVVLLVFQGVYVFYFARCPTCGGRLASHEAFNPRTTRDRFQLACARCRIVWETRPRLAGAVEK